MLSNSNHTEEWFLGMWYPVIQALLIGSYWLSYQTSVFFKLDWKHLVVWEHSSLHVAWSMAVSREDDADQGNGCQRVNDLEKQQSPIDLLLPQLCSKQKPEVNTWNKYGWSVYSMKINLERFVWWDPKILDDVNLTTIIRLFVVIRTNQNLYW